MTVISSSFLVTVNPTIPIIAFSVPDESSLYLVDFYDHVVTSGNETVEAVCCTSNKRSLNVTCGQGKSCSSHCTALSSTLCPTGLCTGDLKDCLPAHQDEGEQRKRAGVATANLPSWVFSKCTNSVYNCQVWKWPKCCFNSICQKKKTDACKWMQYYSGIFVLRIFFLLVQTPGVCTYV